MYMQFNLVKCTKQKQDYSIRYEILKQLQRTHDYSQRMSTKSGFERVLVYTFILKVLVEWQKKNQVYKYQAAELSTVEKMVHLQEHYKKRYLYFLSTRSEDMDHRQFNLIFKQMMDEEICCRMKLYLEQDGFLYGPTIYRCNSTINISDDQNIDANFRLSFSISN